MYGKGGLAIANENHSFNFTQVQANPAGTAVLSETAKAVHTGVVLGAGAEYAFAANWSVKLEYDYVKMFQQQATGSGTLATNIAGQQATIYETTLLSRFTQDLQLVKVGVNYHFSPMPVVAAKY